MQNIIMFHAKIDRNASTETLNILHTKYFPYFKYPLFSIMTLHFELIHCQHTARPNTRIDAKTTPIGHDGEEFRA